jgi:hypothetical protein
MSENLPLPIVTNPGETTSITTTDLLTIQGTLGIKLIGGINMSYNNISSGISTFELNSQYYFIEISNINTTSVFILKGYTGGLLNISTQASDTIDGSNTISLNDQGERIKLFSSGSNRWTVI